MDCFDVRLKIDEIGFDNVDGLGKEEKDHLKNCSDCLAYYENTRKTAQLISILKSKQPVLNEQDNLKSAIMSSIQKTPLQSQKSIFKVQLLIRILAAAVVALFLTLGIEQYTVLKKVQQLEDQFGSLKNSTPIQEVRLYKSSLLDLNELLVNGNHLIKMQKLPLLLRFNRINKSNFTYDDLNRIMIKEETIQKLFHDQTQKLKK